MAMSSASRKPNQTHAHPVLLILPPLLENIC
jgi:hypothetical protein